MAGFLKALGDVIEALAEAHCEVVEADRLKLYAVDNNGSIAALEAPGVIRTQLAYSDSSKLQRLPKGERRAALANISGSWRVTDEWAIDADGNMTNLGRFNSVLVYLDDVAYRSLMVTPAWRRNSEAGRIARAQASLTRAAW